MRNQRTIFIMVLAWGLITTFISLIVACGGTAYREVSRPIIDGLLTSTEKKARIQLSNDTAIYIYLANTKLVDVVHRSLFIPYRDNKPPRFESVYYETRNLGEFIQNPDYFIVEVLIDSDKSVVTLKPSEICLHLSDSGDSRICPVAWIPPSDPWFNKADIVKLAPQERWAYQNYLYSMCENAFSGRNTRIENNKIIPLYQPFIGLNSEEKVQIDSNKPSCLALRFSIAPPDPSKTFKLVFGKVIIDGRPFKVPEIKYVHSTARYVWH